MLSTSSILWISPGLSVRFRPFTPNTPKHVGTWRNIEPTGKDVSIQGLTFFRFDGGKITEAKVQNDVFGLIRQLDAVVMKQSGASS